MARTTQALKVDPGHGHMAPCLKMEHTKWCPSSLAKLLPVSPITMVMVDITIVFMGFINQLITGGHHPAKMAILIGNMMINGQIWGLFSGNLENKM